MIHIGLHHVLPSNTWAVSYRVPSHKDVIGLVAGLKTRENAQSAALFLSQKLELQLEYCS